MYRLRFSQGERPVDRVCRVPKHLYAYLCASVRRDTCCNIYMVGVYADISDSVMVA